MEHLAVFETDKGHFAVRPMEWTGIWNADGKIQECGLRHTAIFETKEDAEWYANMKNADEQGLLLRLPCKVGDTVFLIRDGEIIPRTADMMFIGVLWDEYGEEWFLKQSEAEQKLKEMNGDYGITE